LPGFEVDKTLFKDDFKKISFDKYAVLKNVGSDVLSRKPLTTNGFSPMQD
jgi:hypothetical protein